MCIRDSTMPMLIANLAAGYTVDYGVLMMGVLFCSIPVSYTHLDVYKRQAYVPTCDQYAKVAHRNAHLILFL